MAASCHVSQRPNGMRVAQFSGLATKSGTMTLVTGKSVCPTFADSRHGARLLDDCANLSVARQYRVSAKRAVWVVIEEGHVASHSGASCPATGQTRGVGLRNRLGRARERRRVRADRWVSGRSEKLNWAFCHTPNTRTMKRAFCGMSANETSSSRSTTAPKLAGSGMTTSRIAVSVPTLVSSLL
jgi:hypothetical protein